MRRRKGVTGEPQRRLRGGADFFPQLPQAREALDDAAAWLRDRLAARR
ncbi:hypothetical protein [Streptomyces albus]